MKAEQSTLEVPGNNARAQRSLSMILSAKADVSKMKQSSVAVLRSASLLVPAPVDLNEISEVDENDDVDAPWFQIFALSSAIFCVALSMMIANPIIPFMVKEFYPDLKKSQIGNYSGFLGGSLYVGTILGALPWGIAAQHFGQKNCLLFGCFIKCILDVLFGFSTSFPMACIVRFFWGAAQGNIFISRSLMGEIVPPKYLTFAFALIGLCFGTGSIIGPFLGAILSYHCDNLGMDFWCNFPFFFPMVCAGFISFCSFCTILFFVKEPERKKLEDTDKESAENEEKKSVSTMALLSFPDVKTVIAIFAFENFGNTGIDASIPLMLINEKSNYGMDLSLAEVGTLMGAAAVTIIPFQAGIYPRLTRKYGLIKTNRNLLITNIFFSLLYPVTIVFRYHKAVAFTIFLFVRVVSQNVFMGANASALVYVNNVCPEFRPRINSVAQALVSVGRLLGNAMFAPLFAAFATTDFPLNPWGIFILCTIFRCGVLYLNGVLDEDIDPYADKVCDALVRMSTLQKQQLELSPPKAGEGRRSMISFREKADSDIVISGTISPRRRSSGNTQLEETGVKMEFVAMLWTEKRKPR